MKNSIKYGSSENEKIEFDTRNACIIGSNGSGKSSLMRRIKQQNRHTVMISAHKNLTIQQDAHRGQAYAWLEQNKDHYEGPNNRGQVPNDNNSLQADFNQMLELIYRDYSEASIKATNAALASDEKTIQDPNRKLDKVMEVWNSIFVDKRILYQEKKIRVKGPGYETMYDVEYLSDGERVVLYILLKLVLSDESQIIVIDEPETFLNPAVLGQLFDECEKLKAGSNFIYFSHSLDFVSTRKDSTMFWISEYSYPSSWTISRVDTQGMPEELIIKIVGSKKQKILFVESENNKDARLYQLIYQDFKVWPVGGCENVINYTKAFNSRTEKFNKEYFGLIDRDLKSSTQVNCLEGDRVFCLPVAVYENLFLNKDIIRFVFTYLGRTDFDTIFKSLENEVKTRVPEDGFSLGYKKSKIQQLFNQEIEAIAKGERQFTPDIPVYESEIAALALDTYENILKSFNQKSLKGCVAKLGMSWSVWQDQVLNVFNTDKADDFREEFLKFMPDVESL